MERLNSFRAVRLRTKLLLSFLLITGCLTTASLLVVRSQVEKGIRDSIGAQLSDSVRNYEAFAALRNETMARSTAQLANLPNVRALVGTYDRPTIQDEAGELLALSGSDLLVLADRGGTTQGLDCKAKTIKPGAGHGVVESVDAARREPPMVERGQPALRGVAAADLLWRRGNRFGERDSGGGPRGD